MPAADTSTTPAIISMDHVRLFLRDRADRNILLDEVQFADEDLSLAMEMATSAFNVVTPQSYFTPPTFPENLRYVLLIGTVRFLLMSESFLQVRNQATYQDGDIAPIGIDDKQAAYAQLAQVLKGEWDELVRGVKTQNNMEGGYLSLGSGDQHAGRCRW
jgi:hypothetical protein